MDINDFDFIAPFYNRLSRLIFRDSLIRAQQTHLDELTENDNVLIVGGGCGELLTHIKQCGKIHYVEKSKKMIQKAISRKKSIDVEYFNCDFLLFDSEIKFDVVICPFFLDCFKEENLQRVLVKCKSLLKTGGKMIVVDFEKSDQQNNLLLRAMHLFFKVVSRLESVELQPINQFVISTGFFLINERILHRNVLFSRLYRNL